MKKIIGILGIAVIAMAMFFSANTMNNSSGDLDLASILNINTANAEDPNCAGGSCKTYRYVGGQEQTFCSACCAAGQTPKCTTFECTCT